MSKTVQKAPGADGLRRLWTWTKQCKKHLEQMAYAACGHGQNSAKSTWSRWLTPPVAMGKTVQKAPGVDSKRRLWPCERSGGAKGFGPLQATCPAPLATLVGLEHVRHLGLGRWQQVASAPSKPPAPPPSPHEEGWSTCATWAWAGGSRWLRPLQATYLPRPPRHTWRAGARAPPGPDGWAGGARWLRPLQATCMPPLATPGGLEHVRHLGVTSGISSCVFF